MIAARSLLPDLPGGVLSPFPHRLATAQKEFWDSSAQVQQQVYDLFARARAKLAVTSCSSTPAMPNGWEQMAGTSYCMLA
jgi:hypothetical protein